jgi:hypothetical protein
MRENLRDRHRFEARISRETFLNVENISRCDRDLWGKLTVKIPYMGLFVVCSNSVKDAQYHHTKQRQTDSANAEIQQSRCYSKASTHNHDVVTARQAHKVKNMVRWISLPCTILMQEALNSRERSYSSVVSASGRRNFHDMLK